MEQNTPLNLEQLIKAMYPPEDYPSDAEEYPIPKTYKEALKLLQECREDRDTNIKQQLLKQKQMSDEDKKRIKEQAYDEAQKSWQLTDSDIGPFQKGYVAGAESEHERLSARIEELEFALKLATHNGN